MKPKYWIRGPFDEMDTLHLGWNNELGWVHPNSADKFEATELVGNLPIETTGIVDADTGKVLTIEEWWVVSKAP